jgi:hypothetical protein
MDVTFLATVNLDDLSDLPGVAQEINDDLTQSGFEVVQVAPWARPTLAQGTPTLQTPNVPTQTQQPIIPNTNL